MSGRRCVLALNALGLVISVVGKMPKEFSGAGNPDNVLGEFPLDGTFLAAPLTILVVLIGDGLLPRLDGLPGAIGLLAMLVIVTLIVIGTFGEPLHPKASDPPLAFVLVWRALGLAVAFGLIGVAASEVYAQLRPRLGSSA